MNQSLLGRLDIAGCNVQKGIGTGVDASMGKFQRREKSIRACPGDHRNTAGGLIDDCGNDPLMFRRRHRRAFTRRSARDQAGNARFDLPFHQVSPDFATAVIA